MSNENTTINWDEINDCACNSGSDLISGSVSGDIDTTKTLRVFALAISELKSRLEVHCNTLGKLQKEVAKQDAATAAQLDGLLDQVQTINNTLGAVSGTNSLLTNGYDTLTDDVATVKTETKQVLADFNSLRKTVTVGLNELNKNLSALQDSAQKTHEEQEEDYTAQINTARTELQQYIIDQINTSLDNKAQTDAVIYAQRSELNGIYKCHAALMAADNQLQAALNRIEVTAADNAYNYARSRMSTDVAELNRELQDLATTYSEISSTLKAVASDYDTETNDWKAGSPVKKAIEGIKAAEDTAKNNIEAAVLAATYIPTGDDDDTSIGTIPEAVNNAVNTIETTIKDAIDAIDTNKENAISELNSTITSAVGDYSEGDLVKSAKVVLEETIASAATASANANSVKTEVEEVTNEAKISTTELKQVMTDSKKVCSDQTALIIKSANDARKIVVEAIDGASEVLSATINTAVNKELASAENTITAAATSFINESIEAAKDTISGAWAESKSEAEELAADVETKHAEVLSASTTVQETVSSFNGTVEAALGAINTEESNSKTAIEAERSKAIGAIQTYAQNFDTDPTSGKIYSRLAAVEAVLGFEDDSDAPDTDNTFSIGDEVGTTVGFIQKGEVLKNKTIKEILHMLLYPETYATIKSFNLFKNITEVLEPKLYYKDDFDGAGTSLTAQAAEFEIEFGNVPLITKDADGNEFNRIVVELTRSTNNREPRTIWTKEILAEDIGDNNIGSFSVDLGDFGIITPDSFGDGRYTVDFKVKVIERFSGVKKEKHSSNVVNSFIFEDPRAAMFCGVASMNTLTPDTENGWLTVTDSQFLNSFTQNSNNSVVYVDAGNIPSGTTPYMTFSGDAATLNYQVPGTDGDCTLLVLYPESVCTGIKQINITEGGDPSELEGGFTSIKLADQAAGQSYVDISDVRYAIWGVDLGKVTAGNTSIEIKFNAN